MSSNSVSEADAEQNPGFVETYSCFPLIRRNQKYVERGGKLLLPSSALERISYLEIPYPLTFKVLNPNNDQYTHVGVFEFLAEEGQVNIPRWMLKSLQLKPGDEVVVEVVTLPPASYCCLEPLTRNFAYVSDTKTVLEQNLRNFACLTAGDILSLYEQNHNQVYRIRVTETKPALAVNIFDCDMEVELAVPEKIKRNTNKKEEGNKDHGKGKGYRLDGKRADSPDKSNTKHKIKLPFIPFTGAGNTLNGKRKSDAKETCELPNKRIRQMGSQSDSPNELTFIREQQKKFIKKQSNYTLKPFEGKGNSLKEN